MAANLIVCCQEPAVPEGKRASDVEAEAMRAALAIDTGGSKCEVLLVRDDGAILGHGLCDYRNPAAGRGRGGSGRSAETVAVAIRQATEGIGAISDLYVTHATLVAPEMASRLSHRPLIDCPASEYHAALALAGEPYGVVALSGTGSLVYARVPDGRDVVLDGLGPLLGDHGSGYHIGLMAVRAAAAAAWHPRRSTVLAQTVPAACSALRGGADGFQMIDFMLSNPDRAEVASLARLVDEAACVGDRIAARIINRAAADLAATVRDAVDRLGLADSEAPLVAAGSVSTRSRTFWQCLCRRVARFAPNLQPMIPDLPQVVGHALLAIKDCSDDPASARARLLHEARARLVLPSRAGRLSR